MSLTVLNVFAEKIPDYDNPYAPIVFDKPVYSWTDKVQISIIAPSWNTNPYLIDTIGKDDGHYIKIFTRGFQLEPYELAETSSNSGIFSGEIILTGFSHDVDGDGDIDTSPRTFGNGPTSGYLETQSDSALTTSFEFADGVVLTKSVPITWNLGSLEISEVRDSGFRIRLVDQDLNLNPESLDHAKVDIMSDSDNAGIDIELVETSTSSGIFEGSILFSSYSPSSGNRLYAENGDKITAYYEDYTLPKPYGISDHIQVSAKNYFGSDFQSFPTITLKDILVVDSSGKKIETPQKDSQLQIRGVLSNESLSGQKFVCFFQIKDLTGSVVSLSWITGQLSDLQSLEVSQSWIPLNDGRYVVEVFVWDSIISQNPLSKQGSFYFEVT